MEAVYRRILLVALNHRALILVGAVILFAGSLYMTRSSARNSSRRRIRVSSSVRLEAPIDYSLDKADELFRPAEEIVRKMPEVRAVYYYIGYGNTVNRAFMMTMLIPKSGEKEEPGGAKEGDPRRNFVSSPASRCRRRIFP